MGKLVTVKTGFTGVFAPLSIGFAELSAGNTFIFTDAEYAALPASVTRAIVLTTSGLPDPVRVPVTQTWVQVTAAQYAALSPPNPSILYVVIG